VGADASGIARASNHRVKWSVRTKIQEFPLSVVGMGLMRSIATTCQGRPVYSRRTAGVQLALIRGFSGAFKFAGLVDLTLSNPQPDIPSHPWAISPHLQASDNPTGPGVGLFVSVPDEFPAESAWAYDAISPVVGNLPRV